jgi:hypothetical protein
MIRRLWLAKPAALCSRGRGRLAVAFAFGGLLVLLELGRRECSLRRWGGAG